MIPARFAACPAFPRLPNGKVDRQALAASSGRLQGRVLAEAATAPDDGNAVQATLVDIWRVLLKLERVGLDDDFFAIGGHSLLATRLVARIRDRLGVELPLIRIFEVPTIRGLADFLVSQRIRE